MKKIVVLFVFAVCVCNGVEIKLLNAIKNVESSGNASAIGDNGKAVGAYQIHKVYVDDVNNIMERKGFKTRFTYSDRFNAHKSRIMTCVYLNHYGKVYERKTGKKASLEVLARIHNGGPNGYKKQATLKYWHKVKKRLK